VRWENKTSVNGLNSW